MVALAACYGAAVVGGLATAGAVRDWYPTLAKPLWNPPAWVFGPVWTVLYGMMAVAVWLVWRQRRQRPGGAPIILFAVQLALNAVWSPLFFGLHRPDLAFVDIVLLWLALAATVWLFLKRLTIAGVLLVPYLLWVSFAAALNFAIWRLNS
ncbi:MAG: TspO/MBR family protein [Phycisphaerae bacterium]